MALLKVWIGALAAVVVFLFLQAILQQQSSHLEHAVVLKRTQGTPWCGSGKASINSTACLRPESSADARRASYVRLAPSFEFR